MIKKSILNVIMAILFLIIIVCSIFNYKGVISRKVNIEEATCGAFKICNALVEGDISVCKSKEMFGRDIVLPCVNEYYLKKAVISNESSWCFDISEDDKRNACFAILYNKIELCERITNLVEQESCKAAIIKDKSYCTILFSHPDILKCVDSIYYFDALKTGNLTLCKNLLSPGEAEKCRAIITKDKNLCGVNEIKGCLSIR